MRIGSKVFLGLPVFAIAVAVALTGCAQLATNTPTDSATPTPTPTSTATALPVPTLPVTCAKVLTDAAASSILETPVELKGDETTIRGVESIAALQSGALSCIWGAGDQMYHGWDNHIYLDLLPNATSDYEAGVSQVDDGATPYTAGDDSEYLCHDPSDGGGRQVCTANLLLDGYWVQVNAESDVSGRTLDSAQQSMTILLDSLAGTIGAEDAPNPAWTPPVGSLTGAFCDDVDASTSAVRDAFLSPELASNPYVSQPPYSAAQVATTRAGTVSCRWASDNSTAGTVWVEIVPGGAWADAQLLSSPPTVPVSEPPFTAVTIPDSPASLVQCYDGCRALLSIGGSSVGVYVGNVLDTDVLTADLARLAAAILAAG